MTSEPQRPNSSFNRPTAFSRESPRRQLEQTSSARPGRWWAGEYFSGFICCRLTAFPRLAACQAASQPARPPPIILTVFNYLFSLPPSLKSQPSLGHLRNSPSRLRTLFISSGKPHFGQGLSTGRAHQGNMHRGGGVQGEEKM